MIANVSKWNPVTDDGIIDKQSPAYLRGREQLAEWHNECRRKRLGIDAAERILRRKLEHDRIIAKANANKRKASAGGVK